MRIRTVNMENNVIFWDFDGTLSHPNKAFSTALYDAAAELGCPLDRAAAAAFLEGAYPWKTPFADHTAAVGELWWAGMFEKLDGFCRGAGIPETDLEPLHLRFRQRLTAAENYGLYPDTCSTLERCRELGYRNCLLTNNYPEIVENLEKLGIAPYFDGLIVSAHVGFNKPRKELFDYAKRLAGDPENCWMIGDNPVADIGGGKAAGMKTIYVHNGLLRSADCSVQRLEEIPELL